MTATMTRERPAIHITLPIRRRRASATVGAVETADSGIHPIRAIKRTIARASLGFQRWMAHRSTFVKFFTFFAGVATIIIASFSVANFVAYMTIGWALYNLGYWTAAFYASEITAFAAGLALVFMGIERWDRYFV